MTTRLRLEDRLAARENRVRRPRLCQSGLLPIRAVGRGLARGTADAPGERVAAVPLAPGADAVLDTRGDPWVNRWHMATALIPCRRLQDRALARLPPHERSTPWPACPSVLSA